MCVCVSDQFAGASDHFAAHSGFPDLAKPLLSCRYFSGHDHGHGVDRYVLDLCVATSLLEPCLTCAGSVLARDDASC